MKIATLDKSFVINSTVPDQPDTYDVSHYYLRNETCVYQKKRYILNASSNRLNDVSIAPDTPAGKDLWIYLGVIDREAMFSFDGAEKTPIPAGGTIEIVVKSEEDLVIATRFDPNIEMIVTQVNIDGDLISNETYQSSPIITIIEVDPLGETIKAAFTNPTDDELGVYLFLVGKAEPIGDKQYIDAISFDADLGLKRNAYLALEQINDLVNIEGRGTYKVLADRALWEDLVKLTPSLMGRLIVAFPVEESNRFLSLAGIINKLDYESDDAVKYRGTLEVSQFITAIDDVNIGQLLSNSTFSWIPIHSSQDEFVYIQGQDNQIEVELANAFDGTWGYTMTGVSSSLGDIELASGEIEASTNETIRFLIDFPGDQDDITSATISIHNVVLQTQALEITLLMSSIDISNAQLDLDAYNLITGDPYMSGPISFDNTGGVAFISLHKASQPSEYTGGLIKLTEGSNVINDLEALDIQNISLIAPSLDSIGYVKMNSQVIEVNAAKVPTISNMFRDSGYDLIKLSESASDHFDNVVTAHNLFRNTSAKITTPDNTLTFPIARFLNGLFYMYNYQGDRSYQIPQIVGPLGEFIDNIFLGYSANVPPPTINAPFTHCDNMFMNAGYNTTWNFIYPGYDFSHVDWANSAFEGCRIFKAVSYLNFPDGAIFRRLFDGSHIRCLEGINSVGIDSIAANDMFTASNFVSPDTAAQGVIKGGANWTDPDYVDPEFVTQDSEAVTQDDEQLISCAGCK